jgi:hypothetical protein
MHVFVLIVAVNQGARIRSSPSLRTLAHHQFPLGGLSQVLASPEKLLFYSFYLWSTQKPCLGPCLCQKIPFYLLIWNAPRSLASAPGLASRILPILGWEHHKLIIGFVFTQGHLLEKAPKLLHLTQHFCGELRAGGSKKGKLIATRAIPTHPHLGPEGKWIEISMLHLHQECEQESKRYNFLICLTF